VTENGVPQMFLKNSWYVAGWDDEVTRAPRQIEVLGEKIVVFRKQDGEPAALEDACPHRKLPLSMGRVIGDHLECGYHGMTFDCSGGCIRVPGQDRIPPSASVRGFPVESRWGLVWIWMGDPALADPDSIFEVEHYDDPEWGINRGDPIDIDCNYLLVTDNLLDPSHVAWVHQSSFGSAACEEEPLNVDVADDGVTVWRWMLDVDPAPFYAKLLTFEGKCDRKQHYEVRYPSLALIKAIFSPAGTGGQNKELHEQSFIMNSYNFMTPVNEKQTRYYWFQLRNVKPDCEETSKYMSASVKSAFEEDRVILNAVQAGLDTAARPPIDIAIDAGGNRFLKRLERLIEQERSAISTAAE